MKAAKSYIIWMPKNGTGKSRQIVIRPGYLIALVTVLSICVISIPFFQKHINSLNQKIAFLENNSTTMKSEISNLRYLKQNLERIENKDRQLSEYFGIEDTSEEHKGIFGQGGAPDMPEYLDSNDNTENYPADSYLPEHLDTLESNFAEFEKLLTIKETIQDHTPNIIPVEKGDTRLTSGFGWRESPFTKRKEFHAALDIAGNWGTEIIAPANSIVLKTGHDSRLGNYIVLRHSDEIKTIYGHLSRVLVKDGQEIPRGKKIALMGNTGLSTSTHLHYMVVKNGRAVNPMEYILDVSEKL